MTVVEAVAIVGFSLFTACLLYLTIMATLVAVKLIPWLKRLVPEDSESQDPAAPWQDDQSWAVESQAQQREKAAPVSAMGSGGTLVMFPPEWDRELQDPPVTEREPDA
ncbi:MAG: hypothetical protein Q8R91_04275 [Candidatus Omnitrophota bacterium]|nr:hypothetical protein [Candidatus Omnitrophota bacterium]